MDGSATASYDINVNEITGISVTSVTSNVGIGGKTTLTAALTHTNFGTISTLPAISWVSGSTDYVTISAATGNSTQATGVAEGSSTITASVDAAYVGDGVSASATATVNCRSTMDMSFRGYWVSPGILYRDGNGNYGLTNERDGENFDPFELYSYYGNNDNKDKYYFKWSDLRQDLGSDGQDIDPDNDKLPRGWIIPSGGTGGMWDVIFNGTPKTEIRVGDTVLDTPGAFANVTVVKDGVNYYGVMLLRDGAVIDVNLTKLGANSKYSDNVLAYDTDFKKFMDAQCIFICCSGFYRTVQPNEGWNDLGPTHEGYYWTITFVDNSKGGYYLSTNTDMRGDISSSTGMSEYRALRLVKPATGPMYP